MEPDKTIGLLFEKEPEQWGLRGDPYLWKEMYDFFFSIPLPESESALVLEIQTTFFKLTGKKITAQEHFFVEHFAHGGISSGYISPEFWREWALPHLISRFKN